MSWWKQAIWFLIILLAAGALWFHYFPGAKQLAADWGFVQAPAAAPSPGNGEPRRGGGNSPASPIITAPVVSAKINDHLTAIGTGRARHTVSLRPYSAGRLMEILVEPGSEVAAGEVIARMDAEAERIALDRAQLALDDARAKLERFQALRSSNTVTAVQLTDAELALRNAELQLREAQLALDRRDILAPISGTVGILPVSPGDYVTSSTDVATIDDRSEILVDFWVPERFARVLKPGMQLTAESIARPDERYDGVVSALDNQVDPESRTLRVQARIANPSEILRSGMAFRISMQFSGQEYPAVAPLSVQWGTEGAYVWLVRDNTVLRMPVRVVQRNADNILVEGDFAQNDRVVVEGVHAVREGFPIPVAGDESARTTAAET